MVRGILADINARGPVEDLVREMQNEQWREFWDYLDLQFVHFEDVGLALDATDLEIWQTCQQQKLVLITDNRNKDKADSLEATIEQFGTSDCLPVFTIADLSKFRKSRAYAERVLEKLYEYLLQIDTVRGTGRLYLP
jgi:hypothetical protein